jgi:hypothetical protein
MEELAEVQARHFPVSIAKEKKKVESLVLTEFPVQ